MVSLQITSTSQVQASALDLPYTCERLACYGSSTAQWYAINNRNKSVLLTKKARTPVTDIRAGFFPPEPLAGEICGAAPIPEASPQAFVVTHLTLAIRRSGGSCR